MPGLSPEELERTRGGKDLKPSKSCSTDTARKDFFRPGPDSHLGAVEQDRFGYTPDWEYEDPRSVGRFRIKL